MKETQTDVGPSTSKVSGDIPSRAHETKPRTEVDSGDTADDSDAGKSNIIFIFEFGRN